MTTLEHIEAQVQQLSPSDFAKFREWFREYETVKELPKTPCLRS